MLNLEDNIYATVKICIILNLEKAKKYFYQLRKIGTKMAIFRSKKGIAISKKIQRKGWKIVFQQWH